MAEKVQMLALSPTMEQGAITKWVKKVGDSVKQGDVICEVETDKATMDYESAVGGTLLKILVQEGQQAAVGDVIAIIGKQGEDVSGIAAQQAPQPPQTEKNIQKTESAEIEPSVLSSEIKATPLAQKMAQRHGIDVAALTGTGPDGKVTVKDVEQAINAKKS